MINDFNKVKKINSGCLFAHKTKNILIFKFEERTTLKNENLMEIFLLSNEVFTTYRMIHVMKDVEPTLEAYKFFNNNERHKNVQSESFVLSSKPLKMAANFFMRIKKTNIPTKILSDVESAYSWTIMDSN